MSIHCPPNVRLEIKKSCSARSCRTCTSTPPAFRTASPLQRSFRHLVYGVNLGKIACLLEGTHGLSGYTNSLSDTDESTADEAPYQSWLTKKHWAESQQSCRVGRDYLSHAKKKPVFKWSYAQSHIVEKGQTSRLASSKSVYIVLAPYHR